MTDDFKPFVQVSKQRIKSKLPSLKKGVAGCLYIFFLSEMDSNGIVKAGYELLMAVTGVKSAATIASQLRHLKSVDLVSPIDADPLDGVHRYQVNQYYARFLNGAQTTESEDEAGATSKSETTESEDALRVVVVKDSINPVLPIPESPELRSDLKASSKSEVGAAAKSEVPAKPLPDEVADFTDKRNAFEIYEDEGFGSLTKFVGEKLGDWIDTDGEEWAKAALLIAVWHDKKTLAYADGVLRGMRGELPRREVRAQAQARKAWGVVEDEPLVTSGSEAPVPLVASTPVPSIPADELATRRAELAKYRALPPVASERNPHTLWEAAYGQLQLQMPREAFDTWLRSAKLQLAVMVGDVPTYVLSVPNIYAREWLQHRLKKVIDRTTSQVAGCPVDTVFLLDPMETAA